MTIPASVLVQVIPSVLAAGGQSLALNAVFLTDSTAIPIGTVMPFATLADVQAFFGPSSTEATLAAVYFSGFDGATALPSLLYFAQYNTAPAAAYLRSGSQAGVTLAQLQLLSGTLTTVVDGVSSVSLTINLAGATSFSNAASLIQTGIQGGTPTSTATCTYDAQRQAFVIASPTTGASSTLAFATGSLSASLKLTSATGAVVSPGAADGTPAVVMASVVANTQNWATFLTTFEPLLAEKQLFADWVNAQQSRYMYVAWDTDVTALAANASGSFGALTADFLGVCPVWVRTAADATKAALVSGIAASINFQELNGDTTFAFRGQSGLAFDVTDATIYSNLKGNGYNAYAAFATANQMFTQFQPGQISGRWLWIDDYVNQIYLNAQLQLALMVLLQNAKSVPYNEDGYNLVRAACMGPINEGLNFGIIRTGVTLSTTQAAIVNSAAGANVAGTLTQIGWYLRVGDASPGQRVIRGTPPITLFYMSGGSIQQITLASINVQ